MTYTSRDKLNSMHLLGSIGIAVIIAMLAKSWVLFVVIAGALVLASLHSGEIRLRQH